MLSLLIELPAFSDTATAHPEIYGPAENILAKKAEGKPIPPEEYQLLSKMVELVEKRVAKGRQDATWVVFYGTTPHKAGFRRAQLAKYVKYQPTYSIAKLKAPAP